MQVEEILKGLAHEDRRFPKAALEAAIAAKDEITPHLLKVLEHAIEEPEQAVAANNWSHGYAVYLLAQFRETRAYPLIVKIAALPENALEGLLGDAITEGLNRILASVCDGDIQPISSLIESDQVYDFSRSAALQALLTLVATGEKTRDEIMDYFKSLFRGKLAKEPSYAWDSLIDAANELYPEEVYEDIKQAFDSGLAAENVLDLEWVDRKMARGKEAAMDELRQQYQFIDNTIDELQDWAAYQEKVEKDVKEEAASPYLAEWSSLLNARPAVEPKTFDDADDKPQMPYHAPKKVGRNEPCPCGSGKKYKKCCGA